MVKLGVVLRKADDDGAASIRRSPSPSKRTIDRAWCGRFGQHALSVTAAPGSISFVCRGQCGLNAPVRSTTAQIPKHSCRVVLRPRRLAWVPQPASKATTSVKGVELSARRLRLISSGFPVPFSSSHHIFAPACFHSSKYFSPSNGVLLPVTAYESRTFLMDLATNGVNYIMIAD